MRRHTTSWTLALALALVLGTAHAGDATPLPNAKAVRAALTTTPAVLAARSMQQAADAQRRRFQSGPYSWTPGVDVNQRSVETGRHFIEPSVSLSRTFRWFGKAGEDERIGDMTASLGALAVEDAWHESARTLLSRWFSVVRAQRDVARLDAERALATQQAQALAAMVAPGAVSRLDGEYERARLAAFSATTELQTYYPQLPVPPSSMTPPPTLAADTATWLKALLDDNHAIRMARSQAELGAGEAARAARDRIPDPTLGLRYGVERGGEEKIIGLQLSWPLPSAERKAAAQAAAARAESLRENARDTRLRSEVLARQEIDRARRTPIIWRQLNAVADRTDQNAAQVYTAYQLGETDLNSVLSARRRAQAARAAADDSAADAWEARARLLLDAHRLWTYDDVPAEAELAASP